MKLGNLILIPAIVLSVNAAVRCQSRQPQKSRVDTVRAKGFRVDGGLVNVTEGEVECLCHGSQTRMASHQQFDNGDSVRTNQGRAEILLEPGYYLRVARNSEVRLLDLSPANLKIKLIRGSAILEIEIAEVRGPMEGTRDLLFDAVTVLTPRDDYVITRGGAYRLNVNEEGRSELRVLKGLAIVAGSRVGDGMVAALLNGRVELTAAGQMVADVFDNWSRTRAAGLIEANKSLKQMTWYKQLQSGKTYFDILDPEDAARANAAHTISARGGSVNFVEAGAFVRSHDTTWEPLKAGGNLTSGDKVRTAIESRVEIRPVPDFYLFLGGNTEIVYSEQKDGSVSIAVVSGSIVVICEPDPKIREHNTLTLIAEGVPYRIAQKGIFRVNVLPDGKANMLVYDGVATVAGRELRATRSSGSSYLDGNEHPFDKVAQDSLDVWSRRRSRFSESRGIKRLFLLGGLWYLNETTNQYTLVPRNWDYRSPYGGKYSIKYTVQSFLPRRFPSVDESQPRSQERPRPSN
jgi:hypothetical protein